MSSSGRDWHDVKLTRAGKASNCHSDHALLKSKVSISFRLKRQHQRVQRTKKLDVAQLANSETQDTLRDNIASALDDLEETEYKDAASHWAELRTKLFQASADSLEFAKKKRKGWLDENEASVSSLLNELHSLHNEYISNKDSQAQHFNQILNRQSTISEDAIAEVPQRPVTKELDKPLSLDETIKAIKQMFSGKAPGEDGIPPEVYKYGGDELARELTRLFKELWAEREVPQDFKDALIVHLYKKQGRQTFV